METTKGGVYGLAERLPKYKRLGRTAWGFTILGTLLIIAGYWIVIRLNAESDKAVWEN